MVSTMKTNIEGAGESNYKRKIIYSSNMTRRNKKINQFKDLKNYISKPLLPGKSIPSTITIIEELADASSLTPLQLKYLKKYYVDEYG